MHLRSITLKGFKSFPDRTRLEFGPGVSVIVGPNGSGKSNITDARAVGARRAVAARRPRPVDAGRDLRRRPRPAGPPARRGGAGARQLRRRSRRGLRRRSRSCAGSTAPARASTGSTAPAAGWSTWSRCSPTPGWARRCTRSSPRAASRRSSRRGRATAGCWSRRRPGWASTASAAAARSSSSSARRTTSTARSTSSARRARGCVRSSARPRRPSCTPGSSASRWRRAGSWPATPSASAGPHWPRPRPRRPRRAPRATRSTPSSPPWPAAGRPPRRRWRLAASAARR